MVWFVTRLLPEAGEIESQFPPDDVLALTWKFVGVPADTNRFCDDGCVPFTAPENVSEDGLSDRTPVPPPVLPVTSATTGITSGVLAAPAAVTVMLVLLMPFGNPAGLIVARKEVGVVLAPVRALTVTQLAPGVTVTG